MIRTTSVYNRVTKTTSVYDIVMSQLTSFFFNSCEMVLRTNLQSNLGKLPVLLLKRVSCANNVKQPITIHESFLCVEYCSLSPIVLNN